MHQVRVNWQIKAILPVVIVLLAGLLLFTIGTVTLRENDRDALLLLAGAGAIIVCGGTVAGRTFTDLDLFDVERIEVEPHRFNVFAQWGDELYVTLSTHMDTVPPFIPSREDGERIWGRGACDTKGIIASMIHAMEALLADGVRNGRVGSRRTDRSADGIQITVRRIG